MKKHNTNGKITSRGKDLPFYLQVVRFPGGCLRYRAPAHISFFFDFVCIFFLEHILYQFFTPIEQIDSVV